MLFDWSRGTVDLGDTSGIVWSAEFSGELLYIILPYDRQVSTPTLRLAIQLLSRQVTGTPLRIVLPMEEEIGRDVLVLMLPLLQTVNGRSVEDLYKDVIQSPVIGP